MKSNTWVFLSKIPDGYTVRLSKDILQYAEKNGYDYLSFRLMPAYGEIWTHFNNDGDGIYLKVKNGPNAGKYRDIMNSQQIHKFFAGVIFPISEILEDVYGYRINFEWLVGQERFYTPVPKDKIESLES